MRSEDFKQRRHDATAEILVQATEAAIAQKGYESVTMRDIATQAGCALGTLYVYFKSKRELVNALIERHANIVRERLLGAIAAPGGPLERLRLLTLTFLEYFNQNRNFFKVFYSAAQPRPGQLAFGLPRSVQQIEEDIGRAEIGLIRQAQELGEIRRDFPPEAILSFRKGLTMGLMGELNLREELPSQDEQMRIVWGFQTGGIGARGNHADMARP